MFIHWVFQSNSVSITSQSFSMIKTDFLVKSLTFNNFIDFFIGSCWTTCKMTITQVFQPHNYGFTTHLSEAFYFGDLKTLTYQWTNQKPPFRKTIFNNKKDGGTIFANSPNLPHQPHPYLSSSTHQISQKPTFSL